MALELTGDRTKLSSSLGAHILLSFTVRTLNPARLHTLPSQHIYVFHKRTPSVRLGETGTLYVSRAIEADETGSVTCERKTCYTWLANDSGQCNISHGGSRRCCCPALK